MTVWLFSTCSIVLILYILAWQISVQMVFITNVTSKANAPYFTMNVCVPRDPILLAWCIPSYSISQQLVTRYNVETLCAWTWIFNLAGDIQHDFISCFHHVSLTGWNTTYLSVTVCSRHVWPLKWNACWSSYLWHDSIKPLSKQNNSNISYTTIWVWCIC